MEDATSALSAERTNVSSPELISLCKCLLSTPSDEVEIPPRKKQIFSIVSTTENYLRERRIPELLRFIIAKIIAGSPRNPADYAMRLMDECMVFRAGVGQAPVLFEDRHLEAVVKSFDPGQRGWLSAGQVRRAFTTMGLTPEVNLQEKIPTEDVLKLLKKTQERELFHLLSAGMNIEEMSNVDTESVRL